MTCFAAAANEMLFAWLDSPRTPIDSPRSMAPVRIDISAASPRKAVAPAARVEIEEDAERWDGLS